MEECKIIYMKCTVKYINEMSQAQDPVAIDLVNMINDSEHVVYDNYIILK